MKFNLTAKILFTSLVFCGAIGAPAIAQNPGGYSPTPAPGQYPGSYYPAPGQYPNPGYPAPPPSVYPPNNVPPVNRPPVPKTTAFICGSVGKYPATLVQVNGRTLQSPLIIFQTASENLTPQERCNDVSQRMNRAVAQNGGKLSTLLLTTGKVNSQAVICFVNTAETCNPSNVILTLLRRENAKDPGKVLSRIVRFGRAGGGTNVLESGGFEGGGEEIIPQSVSLEEAVNQLASESNSLESGGASSIENQNPGNYTPEPSAGGGGSI